MWFAILWLSFAADKLGDLGDSCTAAADCEVGLSCHNQECVAKSCVRASDCPGAMRCTQKKCVAPPAASSASVAKRALTSPPDDNQALADGQQSAAPAYRSPGYGSSHRDRPYQMPRGHEDRAAERLRPGDEIPPGAHVESRRVKPLWVAGLVIDLGVWAIRSGVTIAICSGTSCGAGSYVGALVPVLGAWIQLTDTQSGLVGALVASGLIEAGGFALFIAGVAIHHDYLVWDTGGVSLRVIPVPTPHGSGLAVLGHF